LNILRELPRGVEEKNGREEKNMRYLTILLIFAVGLTFSCASTTYEGKKIDPAKVEKLTAGQTKAEQVEEMFGKPERIEQLPSGESDYIYEYCRKNPEWYTIDDLNAQKLEVFVRDGVVQTFKFSEERKRADLKK
jgi:outer membrane protein assembly factor BamE (lipoprotein component of BamABCDE complex)